MAIQENNNARTGDNKAFYNGNAAAGLKYVKLPRNTTEYTLMKGVTDFSNLKQFDLFEGGYSFLTVVSVPRFMAMLATKNTDIQALQDNVTHIMECEFKGLSGLPDVTADAGEINNGANSIQLINNVTMDTSIQISMEFYERSGSPFVNYLNYYLTGIKDPYSKAKTYHGLIGDTVFDPGPDYEVFTFLYYVTDNTMRMVEKAYLFANAQPTAAPNGDLYAVEKGQYDFKTISLQFNCFPIVGDTVNKYAAMMLNNDLNAEDNSNRRLVLDSNNYNFNVFEKKAAGGKDKDGFGLVSDILSGDGTEVQGKMVAGQHLGDNTQIFRDATSTTTAAAAEV